MSVVERCLAGRLLTARIILPMIDVSRRSCSLHTKAGSFPLLHSKSFREDSSMSINKCRVDLVFCFEDDKEKISSSNNAYEFVEIKSNKELAKPKLDSLENQRKNLGLFIQKVINKILPVQEEHWIVPWKADTIMQVMLLWIASFWFVGSWVVPFLSHAAGFRRESLTHRGQALYSLITDVAEGLAGIAVLHGCLAKFHPLPAGWFSFNIKGFCHLDVGLGCLLFPVVNFLSQININLVSVLTAPPPVAVSGVEQSIIARDPVAMALYAVVVSVCAPLWEEIVFRGFLLPSLTRYMPLSFAIMVSSAAFALAHFNTQRLLPLLFLGVVMGTVFARSRNLMPSMVLHSLWNGFVFLDLMK